MRSRCTGSLAAVMEIYSPNLAAMEGLKGSLEVVTSENTRPLTTSPIAHDGQS